MKPLMTSLDIPKRESREGYMQKAANRSVELASLLVASEADDGFEPERAAAHAIFRAGQPSCDYTYGWWVYDGERGIAIPRSCKRWQCDSCRRFKRLAVLVALQHGLASFHAAGHEVHALTLTDGHGQLDFAQFYEAWGNRLRPWLRRHGYLHAYASALEVQPASGRLHCHCLVVAPIGTSGFVPHADLSSACTRAGLGYAFIQHVKDIPAVSDELVTYFVKTASGGEFSVPTSAAGEIGSYMAKAHELEALAGLAASRLRPFRVSRNWPLNLSEATKRLREEMFGEPSPGSWAVVHESRVRKWLDPLRNAQRIEEERGTRWQAAKHLASLNPSSGAVL